MKICQHCQQPLQGRKGKKFCDEYCKSAYHNQKRQIDEGFVTRINKILKTNWKILNRINPQGKSTLRKEYLKSEGYNFNYFTNVYRAKNGNTYYFCYDKGILEIDASHVCIVNWQDYMTKYKIPIGMG